MDEPTRNWPRVLGVTFGVVLTLALLGGVFATRWTAPETALDLHGETGRLVVLPVHNATGENEQDWVRLALARMVAETLAETRGVEVVAPERVASLARLHELPDDRDGRRSLRRLAFLLGAQLAADFELRLAPRRGAGKHERYRLDLVVYARDGEVLGGAEAAGPDPVSLAGELGVLLANTLSPQLQPVPMDRVLSPSPFLNRLYGMGLAALDDGGCAAARPYFEIALRTRESFAAARLELAHCERREGRLSASRQEVLRVLNESQSRGLRHREGGCYGTMALLEVLDGDPLNAVEIGRRGLAIATDRGDRGGRMAALERLARLALGRGDMAKAVELYDDLLAIQSEVGDQLGRAETLVSLGNLELGRDHLEAAETRLQEALGMVQEVGDLWTEMRVVSTLGELARRRGDAVTALDLWGRALTFYEQRGETGRRILLQRNVADTWLAQDELEAAEEAFQTLRELAIAQDDEPQEAAAAANLTWILLRRGYPAIAKNYLDRALELDRHLDNPVMLQRLIAWYAYEQGNFDLAISTLEAVKRQTGDRWSETEEAFLQVFIAAREKGERLPLPKITTQ